MDRFIEKDMDKDIILALKVLELVILGIMGLTATGFSCIYIFMLLIYGYHVVIVLIVNIVVMVVLIILSFAKLKKDVRKIARAALFGSFFIPIYFSLLFAYGIVTGWMHIG